jgi:ABC-type transport system involved in multi-copper enzyme maturation permease subunit
MLGIHHYLWRLIPANPILLRVVETGGKRRRDLFIRCAYLGLLILVVVFSLMTSSGDIGGGSLSGLAKTSAKLFQVMSYLQLGLVALLAPVFTAGAITQEKDSQTYDILLSTPLTNGQIVLGSLLSRLFFVITLLISGIPIFSITQIFGGVSIRSIVLAFGIAAATAFATGALAMAIATFKVGTRRTIFSFYLFIVIFMVGGVMLDRLPSLWVQGPTRVVVKTSEFETDTDDDSSNDRSQRQYNPRTGKYESAKLPQVLVKSSTATATVEQARISWMTPINPFLALRVVFRDTAYAPPSLEDLPPERRWWPVSFMLTNPTGFYISMMFAISLGLVMPSVVLLRRMAQSSTNVRQVVLTRLGLARADRTRKPRSVWHNPIAWREARTKASAARATVLRYSFITAGLLAAGYLVVQYSRSAPVARPLLPADYDAAKREVRLPSLTSDGKSGVYQIEPGLTEISLADDNGEAEELSPFERRRGPQIDLGQLTSPVEVVTYQTFAQETLTRDIYGSAYVRNPETSLRRLVIRAAPRAMSATSARQYLLALCAVEFAVILLIVTNAAASTVTREKEDGTLDLLLSSPITSRYYIWGKLRGLVSFVLPLVAVPVASVAVFVLSDSAMLLANGSNPTFRWLVLPEAVALLPAMLVIVCAFAAILGMQMSLRCRTTVMAVMSSVGIVVGICALMGWCGYALLLKQDNAVSMVAAGFSPFTLMQALIDPYSVGGSSFNSVSDEDLTSRRVTLSIFTVLAVGLYVAVVWQMYSGMVKNFDMTIRKQSR